MSDTTSDRELLELAARAHGYHEDATDSESLHGLRRTQDGDFYWVDESGWVLWEPRENDGQALRLAVKLGLLRTPEFSHFLGLERFAAQEYDDCYAHRRAIVRAAAAMAVSRGEKTE